MSKRKKEDAAPAPAAPFNNPFSALQHQRASLPPGPAPASSAPTGTEESKKGPARAVVRLERKGHGGKEMTVVSHLELAPKERELWLQALKAALGCGGVLGEDGELLLQGDQRERVEPLLLRRGVRKVTRG